jgi:hypothetical protein
MQPFFVRCHPPGAPAPPVSFFILSRGDNSGRPAYTPNPNCFAFTCVGEDLTTYYWLVFTLWETGQFRPYHRGSVISLIRIGDVKTLIQGNLSRMDAITKARQSLNDLRDLEINLKEQLVLIKEFRRPLLARSTPRWEETKPNRPRSFADLH